MPTGVYYRDEKYRSNMAIACKGRVFSDETRKKLSLCQIGEKNHRWGKHPSKETLKKMSLAQSGRKHLKSTKVKIRNSHLGKKFTEEHKKNISIANRGRKVSLETRIKLSSAGRGRRHTQKTKKKISLSNKKRMKTGRHNFFKGCHPSLSTRQKMSTGQKGRKHPESVRSKMRRWHLNHPNRKFKNTKIEIKIENELIKRKINYKAQKSLCGIAIVDFYLPDYKIVIQADGCYYHYCPTHFPLSGIDHRDRDRKQDAILKNHGFKVYRFWEHDINKSVKRCINKIKEIKKTINKS